MALHFANQTLDALVQTLLGLSITGARVYAQDDYPRAPEQLPCVNLIFSGNQREPRSLSANGRPDVTNLMTITVQCVSVKSNSARREAVEISKEVEERWLATVASERLTARVGLELVKPLHRATLVAQDVQVDNDAELAYAVVFDQYEVKIYSTEGRPDLT